MPWDGLEETSELVCDENLDRRLFSVGSYMGQSLWVPAPNENGPFIPLGLSDFTIEWVLRFRDGDPSIGFQDFSHWSGFVQDTGGGFSDLVFGQQWLPNGDFASQSFAIQWDGTKVGGVAGGTTFIAWPPPQSSWVHVAGTYDRDGLLEGWVNGVRDLLDPTDISPDAALVIPPQRVYPFTAEIDSRQVYDNLSEDPEDVELNKLIMAGFAVHNRLLTPAEIAANSAALTVGNYGAGTTWIRHDFTKLVDAAGDRLVAETDTDLSHIGICQKWTVPSPYSSEIFGVLTPDGTGFIEDSSGNGRHSPFVSAESYGNASLSQRCIAAFAETGAF